MFLHFSLIDALNCHLCLFFLFFMVLRKLCTSIFSCYALQNYKRQREQHKPIREEETTKQTILIHYQTPTKETHTMARFARVPNNVIISLSFFSSSLFIHYTHMLLVYLCLYAQRERERPKGYIINQWKFKENEENNFTYLSCGLSLL